MDCTTIKNYPSQTLLDYSILSIAVSPELYSVIILSTPTHFLLEGRQSSLLLNFLNERGDLRGSHFLEGVAVDLVQGVANLNKKQAKMRNI